MYNIDYKNLKRNKIIWWIFLGIAIFFTIGIGIFISFNQIKLSKMDSEVMSLDVEILTKDDKGSTMYSPVYYYQVNGTSYKCKTSVYSSINPGELNDTVYYNSKNPSECMTDYSKKNSLVIYIFLLIPLIFGLVGLIPIININKKIKRVKKLNENGKLIKNVPYTLINSNISINGRRLPIIVVEYKTIEGELVKLKSEPRYDYKSLEDEGTIDLLIDESNYKNYYIEFDIDKNNY